MSDDTAPLRGISSMATRLLLAELAQRCEQDGGPPVRFESVGGVDAARRVQAGEPFDLVVLASDALDKLIASGHVLPGRVDLANSGVSIAVREGAPRPDVGTEAALREAVLAAPSIGYSTGPSGVALMKLFERWGVAERVKDRCVQATPGVPVGSMVAGGQVALGFQQRSELLHVPGIALLGPMPPGTEIDTVFAGGVCAASTRPDAARAVLAFMRSPAAAEPKRRQGLSPA